MLNEQVEKIAKGIIQYQYFQTKIAIERIGNTGINPAKMGRWFEAGVSFINGGWGGKKLPMTIRAKIRYYLDQKLQPLTPKQNEKRKYKPRKKIVKNNIAEVVNKITSKKLTEKFEYGVKFDNTIKIFDTENECKAFCEAGEVFASFKNFEIVAVTINNL